MILITGITGNLGYFLAQELSKKTKVVGVVNPAEKDSEIVRKLYEVDNLQLIFADVREDFSEMIGDIDNVIHSASLISIAPGHKERIFSVNVGGTENLLKIAKKKRANFIYVSSVHAFSELPKGSVITEDTEIDENKVRGNYAKSKAIATKMVLKERENGMKASVVFPTGIINAFDTSKSFISKVVSKYSTGKLRYTINGSFDFVDVRDVAEAIVKIYKEKLFDKYTLSGEKLDFSVLPKVCGLKKYKVLDNFTAYLYSYFCVLETLFGIENEFLPYALHTLSLNYTFSHEKATGDFGYFPRSIKNTLIELLENISKKNHWALFKTFVLFTENNYYNYIYQE